MTVCGYQTALLTVAFALVANFEGRLVPHVGKWTQDLLCRLNDEPPEEPVTAATNRSSDHERNLLPKNQDTRFRSPFRDKSRTQDPVDLIDCRHRNRLDNLLAPVGSRPADNLVEDLRRS